MNWLSHSQLVVAPHLLAKPETALDAGDDNVKSVVGPVPHPTLGEQMDEVIGGEDVGGF